ncbi:MAG TPA: hypothetical protein VMG10_27255 [Gemmataceae bacterium]|nr:hypothetical protein [Gemmataceae bacterium]
MAVSSTDDRIKLLFAPYQPPALKVGDRTFCLYRDAEVLVYDWSLAPLSWPLCYQAARRGVGKGILVDDELARAVRHESVLAVQYWWGVCQKTVCQWRSALGVRRLDSEGSRRLIHQAALGGLNARHSRTAGEVRLWTAAELALLKTLPDAEVVSRTGRSYPGVRSMRRQMGLPVAEVTEGADGIAPNK